MKKKAAAKKKTARKTAKTKTKTKPKAMKAKSKAKPKARAAKKATAHKAVKTAPKTKQKAAHHDGEHGLTVVDLFRLKQEREQQNAQNLESLNHKKDLPPQDQHAPEDAKGGSNVKKGGFGGARHH